MYHQITTECNMTCIHCGFACTNIGERMSKEVFLKALRIDPDIVTIGGGEPTLHPQFLEFMMHAIAATVNGTPPMVVTNGSITETALILANLAKKGVIHASLSIDEYHDPIDSEVIAAFQTSPRRRFGDRHDADYRETRTVTSLINSGRCDFGDNDGCICDDLVVKPNGNIHYCGCADAPVIGTVHAGIDDKFINIRNTHDCYCWKSAKEHYDAPEISAKAA